ncbi:unnamed protein product [Lampetra planeri]
MALWDVAFLWSTVIRPTGPSVPSRPRPDKEARQHLNSSTPEFVPQPVDAGGREAPLEWRRRPPPEPRTAEPPPMKPATSGGKGGGIHLHAHALAAGAPAESPILPAWLVPRSADFDLCLQMTGWATSEVQKTTDELDGSQAVVQCQ